MRPIRLTYSPDIANLTRYLSNATGATWTLTETNSSDSLAHTVTIKNDSATNHSAKTAILIGTDSANRSLTETVNLPGSSLTVTSTRYFKTLISITPSATIGADTMDIGQGEFMSMIIPLNWRGGIDTINLDIAGTIDVTIQQTFDDVQSLEDFDYTWQNAPSIRLVNATASTNDAYEGVPTAIRLISNSSSPGSKVTISIVQRDV
jgi:hypothetical protein|tara:strand:- start:549 stop:1166 length:618 start_codon:yes stop_codon:yes gene_type:complete